MKIMNDNFFLLEQYKICSDLHQKSIDRYLRAKIFCIFSLTGLILSSMVFRAIFVHPTVNLNLICLWNIFFYISIIITCIVVFSDLKYRKKIIKKRKKIILGIETKLSFDQFDN